MEEGNLPDNKMPTEDVRRMQSELSAISKTKEKQKNNHSSAVTLPGVSIEPVIKSSRNSLDYNVLQRLFDTRNSSTPATRVRDLLVYAWRSPTNEIPLPVPNEIAKFIPPNFNGWVSKNIKIIERIVVNEIRRDELNLRTDEFVKKSFFLSNAIEIDRRSMGRREGQLVQVGARLIINRAHEAMIADKSNQLP